MTPTTRRTFIKRASVAAAGVGVPGLLSACGTTSPTGSGTAQGGRASGPRWSGAGTA